ncbi:MAG: hypothetical protein HY323_05430 [Betaproteobacteria bacterium]|nr:hypothetical protein [Betaproteobacteria bacterium]
MLHQGLYQADTTGAGSSGDAMAAMLDQGDELEQGAELSPVEHLRAAIEHAQAALISEPDDQDSQMLAKIVQGLYQILAGRQAADDRAGGGSPDQLRALRRAYPA